MSEHQFVLERYTGRSTRSTCPACEKLHQFTRYVNVQTGEPIGTRVGRCNRETNCGYHYTPKQHFADNPNFVPAYAPARLAALPLPKRPADTLPWKLLQRSLSYYEGNAFVQGLAAYFTEEVALDLACLYLLGTARNGGTVFWQVDETGAVRTGKIIRYEADSLKRLKQTVDGREVVPQWAHTRLGRPSYQLHQCMFGQHLLAEASDTRPIAIVEGEKTAVLCTVYLPAYRWLATGGCGAPQFKDPAVLAALRPYPIWLFPDTGATDKWEAYANDLRRSGLRVEVRADLEATQLARPPNWDLADEFLAFALPANQRPGTARWALTEPGGYPVFWDYPATKLRSTFSSTNRP